MMQIKVSMKLFFQCAYVKVLLGFSVGISAFIQHIGPMEFLAEICFSKVVCVFQAVCVFLCSSWNFLDSGGHKCNGYEYQCGASEWQGLHLGSAAGPHNPRIERHHEKGQLLDLYLFDVAVVCIFVLIERSRLDMFFQSWKGLKARCRVPWRCSIQVTTRSRESFVLSSSFLTVRSLRFTS